MQFFRKRAKKDKIFENLGKIVQNLKISFRKGRLMRAIIACMKQLEYALNTMIKMGLVMLPLDSGPKLAVGQ